MNKKLAIVSVGGLLLLSVMLANGNAGPAAFAFETRCGWFENPTPANISLYDRDGEWIIGVQGGHQAEGDWDWPVFKKGQWVRTNGNYGYGCACLQVRVDHDSSRVIEVKSAQARTLAACRNDKALQKWKR